MKALSIKQPWAWLIVNGYKPVENRSWYTSFRGLFPIHAGKSFDRAGYEWVRQTFPEIAMPLPSDFSRGGIVGAAELVDCVKTPFSPWFFGPYGFVLARPVALGFIPCRGALSFFNMPEEVRVQFVAEWRKSAERMSSERIKK